MPLAQLSIDLVAKLANLQEGLDKAALLAQQNAAKIQSAFEGTRDTVALLAKELLAIYGVHAFIDLISGAIDFEEHLVKLAHTTQLTVEQIGGISFAAKQAGVDGDTAATALGRLNVALSKAQSGDEKAAAPFKAMSEGLTNIDRSSKTASQALVDISAKFATYADGPQKAQLAQAIFGRGYQEILAVLAEGPDELQKNIDFFNKYSGITTDSAEAAKAFKDRLNELHVLTGQFATTLGQALIPTLQALVNLLIETKENSTTTQGAARGLADVFDLLVSAGAFVVHTLGDMAREIASLAAQSVALFTLLQDVGKALDTSVTDHPFDKMSAAIAAFKTKISAVRDAAHEDIAAATAAYDKFQQDLSDKFKKGGPEIDFGKGNGWDPLKQAPSIDPKAGKDTQSAIDSLIKKLNDETIAIITSGDAMSETEKVLFKLATDTKLLAEVTPQTRAQLLSLADGLDKLKAKFDQASDAQTAFRLSEIRGQEGTDEALRQAALRQEEAFRQLANSTPDKVLEATRKELIDITARFEAGGLSVEAYTQIVQTKLGILPSSFAKQTSLMEDIAVQAGHDIESALGTVLDDALSGKFSSIKDDFFKAMEQMAAKAIATDLGSLIFGRDFAKGGGFGGLLTTLFPALAGFGGKASGGGVGAYSLNRVAENGPELLDVQGKTYLMNGSQSGSVRPLGGGDGWSGPPINISIAAGVTRNDLASILPQLKQTIKAELQQEMRRPGYQGG